MQTTIFYIYMLPIESFAQKSLTCVLPKCRCNCRCWTIFINLNMEGMVYFSNNWEHYLATCHYSSFMSLPYRYVFSLSVRLTLFICRFLKRRPSVIIVPYGCKFRTVLAPEAKVRYLQFSIVCIVCIHYTSSYIMYIIRMSWCKNNIIVWYCTAGSSGSCDSCHSKAQARGVFVKYEPWDSA